MSEALSLFEKIDATRSGEVDYSEDIRRSFDTIKENRVAIFKEYIYYVAQGPLLSGEATEVYEWLKTLNVQI